MSRRRRTILYGAISFIVCAALILATAYGSGADPLHERSRHIWALSLVAAAYVSFRGALIIERMGNSGDDSQPKRGWSAIFKSSEHDIDRRMNARRERVAAAKAARDETEKDT